MASDMKLLLKAIENTKTQYELDLAEHETCENALLFQIGFSGSLRSRFEQQSVFTRFIFLVVIVFLIGERANDYQCDLSPD